MSPLQTLLATFRNAAENECEKGTYFEELYIQYRRHEATYGDLYSDAWTYSDRTKADTELGYSAKDTGIPLELFMREITVSLKTMKIVNGLPVLDI